MGGAISGASLNTGTGSITSGAITSSGAIQTTGIIYTNTINAYSGSPTTPVTFTSPIIVPKIIGGTNTSATGINAVVCGGAYNTVSGDYSIISGGHTNNVTASAWGSFIGGGQNNTIISANSDPLIYDSAICGGNYNKISGSHSFIGAGNSNTVLSDYCFIGSGFFNKTDTGIKYTSIISGVSITATENYTAYTYNLRANGNIQCSSTISASTNVAYSDERIKTNIIDINDTSALAIIRQIQPKIYNYKDVRTRGDTPVWGFIAQQVKSVLDYSTTQIKECIPDIYELADLLDSNTIKLNIKTTVNFEVNKRIRLMNVDNHIMDTKITGIIDDYTFTVEGNITGFLDGPSLLNNPTDTVEGNITSVSDNSTVPTEETIPQQKQIFVYGREIDDFHALNKDAIFTVATAALQEVDKELQAEKTLRQLLETRLLDLENKNINLETRLLDLENKNINLENKNINLENRFLDLESRILNLENRNTV